MAVDVYAELFEVTARDGGNGNAGRRLAGAGALEDGAHVVEAVLDRAGEVCMAGSHRRQPLDLALDRRDGHAALPVGVLPVAVDDAHADGAAHGLAVAHAADDLRAVDFDLLALAAAVALLTPSQVTGDVVLGDLQPGRHPFDDDKQRLPWDSPAVRKRKCDTWLLLVAFVARIRL